MGIKYGRILTHKTLYCPFKTKIKNQNSNFKRFKIRYVRYLNFFLIGIIGDYEKNYQKINRYTLTFCNSNLKLLLAYKNPIKVSLIIFSVIQKNHLRSIQIRKK